MAGLKETPSQTAGPYVHLGLAPAVAGLERGPAPLGAEIAGRDVPGARVRVEGQVFDGDGVPIRDAVIEVWQADARGRYPAGGDGFRGWGRAVADIDTGAWSFETVRPGRVALPDGGEMAPHLTLWIVARGINVGLATRLYFADEVAANAADPILARVPAERRGTLLAHPAGDAYRFDIRLQGATETVFFDI